MSTPPVIVLTDCHDANAVARQSARIAALFGATPSVLPLADADAEGTAALTLLDVLRATELTGGAAEPVTVLVNIAPRDGHWPNGAPFCYFRVGRNLVVSTLNPRVLAPLRRYLGVAAVEVTDVREVLEAAAAGWAQFGSDEIDEIVRTQFRSLWYVPLLARWLVDGRPVPAATTALPEPAHGAAAVRVAIVDNFGNCKLDQPASEVLARAAVAADHSAVEILGEHSRRHLVPFYERLPEVPYGGPGLTVGSSGAGFAELVIRGGSAAEYFGLRQGDVVVPALVAAG